MNTPNTINPYTLESEIQRRVQQSAMNTSASIGIRPPYLDLKQMIAMRLHLAVGQEYPFEFMEAHRSGDTVHVFVVVNDKPITLSDGHTMFPSDDLITKLNLLRK